MLRQAADPSWNGDEWMSEQLPEGAWNAPFIPATITRTGACQKGLAVRRAAVSGKRGSAAPEPIHDRQTEALLLAGLDVQTVEA